MTISLDKQISILTNKQTNKETDQAVLEEVPPHTARELGEAEAESEQEGQPEVVGGHLYVRSVNLDSECLNN